MSNKQHLRAPRPKKRISDHIYSKEARIIPDSSNSPISDTKPQLIDGYKDPTKVFHASVDKAIRERVHRLNTHLTLPSSIRSVVDRRISDCVVINRSGRHRDLLPDTPGRHVMLCHAAVARTITSGIGIFSKITSAADGSWVLAPAGLDMLNQTTVQHVRPRPVFGITWLSWLRRYSYEISFDGRVEPAMMLFDYCIDPTRTRQRFYVSREEVPIRNSDGKVNTFFRFWRDRSRISQDK